MKSREYILSQIEKSAAPNCELPDLSVIDSWSMPIDKKILKQNIDAVGGNLIYAESISDINNQIKKLFLNNKKIHSTVDGIDSNISININTPTAELAQTNVAILRGEFIVEENGAVWVTNENMITDSIITITEYLILIVPKNQIVKNMHQAYKEINLQNIRYGTFISGPSKTADIEQTLVFGAHGAKDLTVFLV